MLTSTFRLVFVSIGMVLGLGIAEIADVSLQSIASIFAFVVALDYIASGIIVRIILSQNEEAVKTLLDTFSKGKSDGRDDSKTE